MGIRRNETSEEGREDNEEEVRIGGVVFKENCRQQQKGDTGNVEWESEIGRRIEGIEGRQN